MDGGAWQTCPRRAGFRSHTRHRSSARRGSTLFARHGDELLGRFVEHDHAPGPRDLGARRARLDALVDVIAQKYAPLPATSLSTLVRRVRYAVPQWTNELSRTLE